MSYSERGSQKRLFDELRDKNGKLPVVTMVLVLLNAAVFFVCDLFLYRYLNQTVFYLAMNPALILENKQYWRLFTSMFYHFGIEHLMSNMLMLYYVGAMLERTIGKVRYLILYFISGIVADFASILYNSVIVKENAETVFAAGASGAISGLFGALVVLTLCCYKRVTLLRKKDVPVFLFFTLFVGFFEKGVDHAAHLGGFAAGCVLGALFSVYLKRKNPQNVWDDFGGNR